MKTFLTHRFPISPEKAAAVVAFSFFGLTAFAAPQPGPMAAAQPAAIGTPSAAAAAAPEEDILDIRGPIHIAPVTPWGVWTAGALAAVGAGFGAWALLRRPKRKLPYEVALEKLAATRPLMAGENAQPFSLAVSEIVRGFIEESVAVRAAHRTTNEFLRDLVSQPDSPLAAHRETLAEFLQHCDLAKFARWSLTAAQMEAMLESASAFVIAIGRGTAVPAVNPPRSAAVPAVNASAQASRLEPATERAAGTAARPAGKRDACATSEPVSVTR